VSYWERQVDHGKRTRCKKFAGKNCVPSSKKSIVNESDTRRVAVIGTRLIATPTMCGMYVDPNAFTEVQASMFHTRPIHVCNVGSKGSCGCGTYTGACI